MSTDFRAAQIQTGKIIVTSSLGNLAVYSIGTPGATQNDGTINDTKLNGQLAQTDTFVFISGSIGSIGTTTKGATVFGGDVAVSGSLQTNGELHVNQGMVCTPKVITTNYTVTTSDYIIGVNHSSPIAIQLPGPIVSPSPSASLGQTFIIKDVAGGARTNKISISGGGWTIDGRTNNYEMTVNYQSLTIINFGGYWSIL